MKSYLACGMMLLASMAFAQPPTTPQRGVILVTPAPSGPCLPATAPGQITDTNGSVYACSQSTGTWTLVSGGGGGGISAVNGTAPVVASTEGSTTTVSCPTCTVSSSGNFIFEGDSRFQGGPAVIGLTCPNGTGYSNGIAGLSCSIPGQASALPFFKGGTTYNAAIGGTTIAQMNTNYVTYVHPHTFAVTGNPCTVFIQTSYNDITAGTALATMESGIQTAWTTAHTDGCSVVMTTMIPGTGNVTQILMTHQFLDFVRTQACSATNAATNCWDKLIDFSTVTPDPYNSTYYTTDNTHEFAGGWALFAGLLNEQMSSNGTVALSIPLFPAGTGTTNYRSSVNSAIALTTASSVTAVGDASLQLDTTGSNNTCIGGTTCAGITTQQDDTGIGTNALQNATGNYEVAVGTVAMPSVTGDQNTAMGYNAGNGVLGGVNNVFVGASAGNNITTGSYNVFIGAGGTGTPGTQFQIAIGQAANATAAHAVEIGDFSTNSTPNSLQFFSLPLAGTNKFTASGCSNGTLVGQATAGSYHSGTSGTCTVVITTGLTAPNGWFCRANDLTTTADLQIQTATSTTTATISGTTVTGDVVNFGCQAY